MFSLSADELHHTRNKLPNLNRRRRIDHQSWDIANIIIRTASVTYQQPLDIPPRGWLVPAGGSINRGATPLESLPPLFFVSGFALDDEDAGPRRISELDKAVEVGFTGERGVDDDADADSELGGGETVDDVVGEVVEEVGSDGGGKGKERALERQGGVTDVVFVDERNSEG